MQNHSIDIFPNFNRFFHDLNDARKMAFLSALLTRNERLLFELINSTAYDNRLKLSISKIFYYFKDTPSVAILHPVLLNYLQRILASMEVSALVPLLLSTFQSVPETSSYSHRQGTISMMSKKEIFALLLSFAETDVQKAVISQVTDLSYDPKLPAYRPTLNDVNYVKSNLTVKEYKFTASRGKVDISEFLVLSIKLLEKCSRKLPIFLLTDLSVDYLFIRYDDCLRKIKVYCETRLKYNSDIQYQRNVLFKLSSEEKNIFTEVLELSKNLAPFDYNKNYTRRFFETRLSQYVTGLMHNSKTVIAKENKSEHKSDKYDDTEIREDSLRAVNKILYFYLGKKGLVHDPKELEINMSIFGNSYKDKSKYDAKELEKVFYHGKAYSKKDRVSRGGAIKERKLEVKASDVGDSVWCSSGGVMDRRTPTFLDSQINPPLRNVLADTTRRADPDEKIPQWGYERKYAAYVGSISGHTGNMVGILRKYMQENKHDPDLSKDINLFLVQFVAVYVKRGFHSILEVVDMLNDESIQATFKSHGVSVNIESMFSDEELFAKHLEYAMDDAMSYTKTLVLKRPLKEEIEKFRFPQKK